MEESGSTMTMAQELSRSSFCGEWNGSSLSKSREEHVEAPDEADEAREDEEMTDLLDFLGGSRAT